MSPDPFRILVVANETVGGESLRSEIRSRSEGYDAEVLVVTPALNSPVRHWTSDEDRARAEAQQRLEASLERLGRAGIDARGEVGDGDPLQAIEDALRTFGADEVIISTHPEGRSHWIGPVPIISPGSAQDNTNFRSASISKWVQTRLTPRHNAPS